MTPEQVALLDQLKNLIHKKSQEEDFIPIHLGIDWTSATLWCHKMGDKDIRRQLLNEALTATQTKGDGWHIDPKSFGEFRMKSDKGLYLWATTKFLLFQIQGKASMNFSFIQRQVLIEKMVKRLNRQSFIERIELDDPIDYGLSRIDAQITLIVKDAKKLFPTPFEYDYKFSSNARVYGKTHKVKGLNFTGMTFKGDGFLLRIYNKSQELENEPDIAKKEIMANRLSPFSKCEVWRIEIQLEGNLNRYKENFNLDEDELTLKIFKDFNKRKKIDFLNRIIEATEARLLEKPRPHGWLFEQPISFPPLL